jgi:hypothetical protein
VNAARGPAPRSEPVLRRYLGYGKLLCPRLEHAFAWYITRSVIHHLLKLTRPGRVGLFAAEKTRE